VRLLTDLPHRIHGFPSSSLRNISLIFGDLRRVVVCMPARSRDAPAQSVSPWRSTLTRWRCCVRDRTRRGARRKLVTIRADALPSHVPKGCSSPRAARRDSTNARGDRRLARGRARPLAACWLSYGEAGHDQVEDCGFLRLGCAAVAGHRPGLKVRRNARACRMKAAVADELSKALSG